MPQGAWQRSRIAVTKADTPPTIDGDISDSAWQNATRAIGFHRFGGGAPVTEQTEAWITCDRDFLYVAFHCLDSAPERIRSSETQRGGELWNDDHVTVEIDSQGTRRGTSSFVVSPRGTQSEYLEGGTAGNITWAGDWKAATKRTGTGWTAEFAIPFRLLRYPRGSNAFGILLYRRLARETNTEVWPYVPTDGQTDNNAVRFMNDFTGIAPPFYAPKPVFLPYVLASGGDGDGSVRQGMDIKYPLTTTLTALATLKPDFKTIENDVASISFSYNEQFVDDRRPFFAEGRGYLPGSDLFYSRRIDRVDEGIKIVGKDGPTSVGVVGALAHGNSPRQSVALRLQRDIGFFSNVGLSAVGDNFDGQESNRLLRLFGNWGGQSGGSRRWNVDVHDTASWKGGRQRGNERVVNLRYDATKQGMPNFRVSYDELAPDFISDLGLVFDRDRRGFSLSIDQGNQFDRGAIETYYMDFDVRFYNRQKGQGFFRDEVEWESFVQNRRGFSFSLNNRFGRRRNEPNGETFQDSQIEPGIGWNQRTLFSRGFASYAIGRQAGQDYRFLYIGQGVPITNSASMNLDYSRQSLGTETTSQFIATGTYRLTDLQTISARLVAQNGTGNDANVAANRGTNLYFAYARRSRKGADLFILLVDPNEPTTKAQLTVKLLRPI